MIERFEIGDVARIESLLKVRFQKLRGTIPCNATVESLTHADLFKTSPNIGKVTWKMNRKSKLVSMSLDREIVELSFSIIVLLFIFFFSSNDLVVEGIRQKNKL